MKKILLLLFSVLLLLSCKDEESKGRIYFAEEEIDLISLSKYQLKVINETPGFETLKYTFKSSDTKIVEVNEDGMITGRAVGTATVTATAEELGLSATCRINVKSYKITLSQETITLKPNETCELSVTLSPEPKTMPEIKWQTDDKDVAIVDNGKITAVNSGETTIGAFAGGNLATCKVIVEYNEQKINLETPGTLKNYLSLDMSKLTITGNINAMDILTMKESTKLINIDMTEAHIVGCQDAGYNYKENILPKNAFSKTSIMECKLPKDLQVIDTNAFYNCKKLESVIIPKTVKKISYSAFDICRSLKSIELPDALELIEIGAFIGTGFKEIIIPSKIKRIQSFTFNGSEIISITLPSGLKTIGAYAFSACWNLEKIELPINVQNIEKGAFEGCKSLTEIHSLNPIPPQLEEEVFEHSNILEESILYIPKGTYNIYSITSGWMNFKNIIEK